MKLTLEIEPHEIAGILDRIMPALTEDHHTCRCREHAAVEPSVTPAVTKQKTAVSAPRPEKQAAKGTDPFSNRQSMISSVENPWKPAELNLLRTCQTSADAQFVYHSHFGDARNDNAIYQRWIRIHKAKSVIRIGCRVKVTGGLIHSNDTGVVMNFTENRQCANVTFPGDSGNYQIAIDNLEPIPAAP